VIVLQAMVAEVFRELGRLRHEVEGLRRKLGKEPIADKAPRPNMGFARRSLQKARTAAARQRLNPGSDDAISIMMSEEWGTDE
jgi:hypothetical protein